MKTIRIYRHPDCKRCAQYAAMHHRLDWFDHVEDTTYPPPNHRSMRKGEIFVQTLSDGKLHEGFDAAIALIKAVPLYWPLLPLVYLPRVRRKVDREIRGGHARCA